MSPIVFTVAALECTRVGLRFPGTAAHAYLPCSPIGPTDAAEQRLRFKMHSHRILIVLLSLSALSSAQMLPWNCNFDDGLCGITQDESDNRDWMRLDNFTPTSNTGPSTAQSPRFFLYFETSDPVREGEVTRFTTPDLQYSGSVCVDFWYHMYGASMGSLKVFSQTGLDSSTISDSDFFVSGDQGNVWINAKVTVDLNSNNGRVGWQATKGNEIQSDIAVDTISITRGACPVTVSPTIETTTPSEVIMTTAEDVDEVTIVTVEPEGENTGGDDERSLPYSCSFETDFCQMNQRTNDNFDWLRLSGGTPTGNSGPNGASQGTFYAYTEMSSPRNQGDVAVLETPSLLYSGDVCISFDYHVYGSTVGNFYVTLSSNPEIRLLDISTDLGNEWKSANIIANLRSGDRVVFTGVTGSDVYGDIAIDSLNIATGTCEVTLPYVCSFENENLCQMTQSENDDFDWERSSGSTGTSLTGPSGASEGSYYMFTEMSSPRVPNDRATLISPELGYTGDICIRFDYHAFGVDFGGFYVTLESSPNNRLLDVTTEQGDQWIPASLNARINEGEKVLFTAVRGSDVRGDAAIDNLNIETGACAKTLPYTCSFEDNFCDMSQSATNDFDWTRLSGQTPTGGTGPTAAYDGEFYAYTEMSSPRQENDVARLETPELDAEGAICVTFRYSAYGSSLGRLYVTQSSNVNNVGLDIRADQGEQWLTADLSFNIARFEKIYFTAVRGSDVYGDFAIDDLDIASGSCGETLPWTCGFESNFCDMEQLSNDQFDWSRNEGLTGTSDTGPTAAYQGTWFMYIEASSPRQNGDVAAIQTPQFAVTGSVCVRFAYNMYGVGINRFYVVNSRDSSRPVFDQTGNKQESWLTAQIDMELTSGDRLVFYGIRGNSIEGDIAVDDLRLTSGLCSDSTGPDPTDAPVTQYVVTRCDMEGDGSSQNDCRISQDNTDDFDWSRATGKTTSGALHDRRIANVKYPITGPQNARNGEYYFFTEASGTRDGDVARIIFDGDQFRRGGNNCLRYAFTMNGYHIGTLRAYMMKNGNREYAWTLTGDQSPDWKQAAVDLNMNSVSQIGLEAVMIGDFSGDIAVDDVSMSSGRCEFPNHSSLIANNNLETDERWLLCVF
ncbi:hypothetical protein CAPTEDRAFT_218762 [Capitella teleta]|uniref:MAM domain-containing protein n=1 Tax=Capitella teleta TaxID=283909 RepID=R7T5D8_CAPTE|nr:hypothetical protein CAPTEDRAFT_218762 [Capitella teleta]|eukprot:ELT88549.1 hypothetical protein CAPTEDRAFT_218762 [Capitella teleta]